MLPLGDVFTLRQLRPVLASCGSVAGSLLMLLQHRPCVADTNDEHEEELECAQLLATLADTQPEEMPRPKHKGLRTERRAVKRPLPLPSHMRDDGEAVGATPSTNPILSSRSCDSDSDDVVWAPRQPERPSKRRRQPPAHLSHRGKRAETGKRWSLEETDAFITGVEQHGIGNWQKVHDACSALFGRRTTVDLKDKWRNLVKAVSTPGLIPRSVRLTSEQKERIRACIARKEGEGKC